MGLWTKSVLIFNAIRTHGQQSVRGLAARIGLSKSSVHRHLQAMDRRDRYPESSLWETEAGRTWLIPLTGSFGEIIQSFALFLDYYREAIRRECS
jgi:Mn-dependent DtxR family transcriptional regulator